MRIGACQGRGRYKDSRTTEVSWRDGGVVVLEILATVLAGLGIGLSLGAPPGPVNAIIASHTVTRSWRAGFLVGVGATTADTIFAWSAAHSWRRTEEILEPKPDEHAKSSVTGLSVNLTSPYPILWWLTVGLVLINQLGPAVLVGFFAGLLLWITVFPLALREAQRRIARTYQAVLAFSIVCLLAFAAWLAWSALAALA